MCLDIGIRASRKRLCSICDLTWFLLHVAHCKYKYLGRQVCSGKLSILYSEYEASLLLLTWRLVSLEGEKRVTLGSLVLV